MTKPINPKVLAKQRKENVPERIDMPLRILMGKSYSKYKKVGENMMFLNKAVRGMSKRELTVLVGYFALKYGIVPQPVPQQKVKNEEK